MCPTGKHFGINLKQVHGNQFVISNLSITTASGRPRLRLVFGRPFNPPFTSLRQNLPDLTPPPN